MDVKFGSLDYGSCDWSFHVIRRLEVRNIPHSYTNSHLEHHEESATLKISLENQPLQLL